VITREKDLRHRVGRTTPSPSTRRWTADRQRAARRARTTPGTRGSFIACTGWGTRLRGRPPEPSPLAPLPVPPTLPSRERGTAPPKKDPEGVLPISRRGGGEGSGEEGRGLMRGPPYAASPADGRSGAGAAPASPLPQDCDQRLHQPGVELPARLPPQFSKAALEGAAHPARRSGRSWVMASRRQTGEGRGRDGICSPASRS